MDSRGEDVQILVQSEEAGGSEEEHNHTDNHSGEPAGSGEHCHFHAGVEYVLTYLLR